MLTPPLQTTLRIRQTQERFATAAPARRLAETDAITDQGMSVTMLAMALTGRVLTSAWLVPTVALALVALSLLLGADGAEAGKAPRIIIGTNR